MMMGMYPLDVKPAPTVRSQRGGISIRHNNWERSEQKEQGSWSFLKNGPYTASFLFIFGLFKQTVQFLQQIFVKKCPSSIRC